MESNQPMRGFGRWRVLLAAVVAGAIAATVYLRWQHGTLSDGAVPPSRQDVADTEWNRDSVDAALAVPPSAAVSANASPLAAKFGPLPPLDAPIAGHLDDLKQRAQQGDAKAACRLAAEIHVCGQSAYRLNRAQAFLSAMQSNSSRAEAGTSETEAKQAKQILDIAVKQAEEALKQSARCDGFPATRPEARLQWVRAAALAGHVPSMRNYASGDLFNHGNFLRNLPALHAYRQEAESLAWRAVAAGDGPMYAQLVAALEQSELTDRQSPLGQVLGGDRVRSYALLLRLVEQLSAVADKAKPPADYEDALRQQREHLSPAEIEQAQRLATEWASRWRPMRGADQIGRVVWMGEEDRRDECDSDHFYDGVQP